MTPFPPARGGQAKPVHIRTPAPRITRPKAPNANQVATQNAMGAFRTALAQLKASTPAVDSNAIYAPYRASEQVTGQLGQGLQQSELNSGQAAQNQYNTALGQAQQQAAQFGISAGAGANPTALQNTGAQPLAQQTNAYAAAAPQAAAQWQQLLERTAAAKVSAADLARQEGLTSAEQSLSGSIPSAIANEKQRLFQAQVQRQNIGLARTQLTEKQNEAYNRDVLGQQSITSREQTSAANRRAENQRSANSISAQNQRSANSISAANQRSANSLAARGKKATTGGLKGIPAAVKALSGSSSTGAKPITGYKVTFIADPNGVSAGGPPITLTVKDPNNVQAPGGYAKPNGTAATPVYGQAGKTNQSVTASQWDAQMRGLLAQNPGKSKAIKAFLGPRPKK